ncbi:uncharacterized protein LTHEOB_11082 [Lasiodiplodia theobromae]|uniref:uncharacterized protein n=1 Tax=Lasiodiplodia theobromae TaxID=45133 RepID=UPI0015C37307|nr:uncharacterized protein LTHEOB_11082 [Lasiodiplodia theobromae]KAF4538134.1 hypothetical protein LTHEOB_11082 [Lasiodiplodia theobromae]
MAIDRHHHKWNNLFMKYLVVFLVNTAMTKAAVATATGAATCYYPDGSKATDYQYVPYPNASTVSFRSCCIPSENDTYLDNGLCYFPVNPSTPSHGNYIYRGGCTDQSWRSDACASKCTSNTPNLYESVLYCSNNDKFCCQKAAKSGSCCDDNGYLFTLDLPAWIMTSLRNASIAPTADNQTAAATHSSASSMLPAISSSFAPPSWTTSRIPTTTSSTAATTQATTTAGNAVGGSSSSSSSNEELSAAASLGLGLGIGVPSLLLMVVGIFFQKKVKAVKISVHNGFKHISGGGGSSVGSRTPRSRMSTRPPSERGREDEEEESSVGEGSSDAAGGEWKGKEKMKVEAEDVGGEE